MGQDGLKDLFRIRFEVKTTRNKYYMYILMRPLKNVKY